MSLTTFVLAPGAFQDGRGSTSQSDSIKLADYPDTDLGNARLFVRACRGRIRFCSVRGKWLIYNGAFWEWDNMGRIHIAIRWLVDEVERIDQSRAQALQSATKLSAIERLARHEPDVLIDPGKLDRDDWLFNVENGTLDLEAGHLRPHAPSDFITRMAPVLYDADAPCPRWEAFLDHLFASDSTSIRYLQRVLGYTLTGCVSEQCLFILFGVGSNGKSTLIETVRSTLGAAYACETPAATLMAHRAGRGIPNDLARLQGIRFVTSGENESEERLAEGLIKHLTGGDTLCARFLRAEFFEFRPQLKLFLVTNHKPTITNVDDGIWRRIRIIPFDVRLRDGEQDPQLKDKLLSELPGILAWMVRGCADWRENSLAVPECFAAAAADYRQEMDRIGRFLEDACEVSPESRVPAGVLYDIYRSWSKENGEAVQSATSFGKDLTRRGFGSYKTNGMAYRCGLKLSSYSSL